MSLNDVTGAVLCPKCHTQRMHVYYFDVDCRGNAEDTGGVCQGCGYQPTDAEVRAGVQELRRARR